MMLGLPKKYLIGIETEYFVLDSEGRISNKADTIIQELAKLGTVKKECAKNMTEVISRPTEIITGAAHDILEKMKAVLEVAEKNDLKIFNYGTYPGRFNPDMRRDGAYHIKEKIFGPNMWKIAGRCVGFHCHYTLVSGLFSKLRKNVKILLQSGKNQAFVDSYNMLIALDTIFSTFLQSSPFYQGLYYGKDSRMMLYRGNLGINGLYTKFPEFGALPEYKHVITEIMYLAESRFEKWDKLMKKRGIFINTRRLYGSIYDVNWSPVKVNPIGTFELRGMDMNRFELLVSCGVLMKHVLGSIHKRDIAVIVDKLAIKEPFMAEGDKVYLPPFSYLNSILQKNSAMKGMDDREVRSYCNRFLKFVSVLLPKDRKKFLRPFQKMVSSRKTLSDEIIREAKKMGIRKTISREDAAELSLKIAEKIFGDIQKTKKLVEHLS